AQIRVYVNLNGKSLNLTDNGLTPQLDLFLEDGSIFIDEPLEIVMSNIGLIQYKIPDKVIKHVGLVKCKLFLKGNNQKVHVANFNFNIRDSGIDEAVAKEISVNLVEDTVKKIMNKSPELFKGEKGDRGEQGIQGVKGSQGERGLQGEQGV